MNDNSDKKSWAYWLMKGIKCLLPYIFVVFFDTLIWCVCKYSVWCGVLFVIALLVLLM